MNTTLSALFLILMFEPDDSASYRIAEYICSHLSDMDSMTMNRMMENCYCSASAITKVIHFAGSSSWGRFKERLLRSSKTRSDQLYAKMAPLSVSLILEKISAFCTSGFDAGRLLEECRAFSSELIQKKRMNIYGSASPLSLSLSFAEDLCLMDIFVCPCPLNSEQAEQRQEGFGCAITFSGRWLESSPESFYEFRSHCHPFAAISMRKSVTSLAEFGILMPHTISTEFDNCVYLLILDLILYQVWTSRSDPSGSSH